MVNIGNGCAIIGISATNTGMDTLRNGALDYRKTKHHIPFRVGEPLCAVRLFYRMVEETNNDIPSSLACEPKIIATTSSLYAV